MTKTTAQAATILGCGSIAVYIAVKRMYQFNPKYREYTDRSFDALSGEYQPESGL